MTLLVRLDKLWLTTIRPALLRLEPRLWAFLDRLLERGNHHG